MAQGPFCLERTPGSLIGEGAFSDVLAFDDDTVVKVFRRMSVTPKPLDNPADHDTVLRAMCDAECSAYELLSGHPDLTRYIPRYYGRLVVSDVTDEIGRSIGHRYILDAAYRLQRVPGDARKVSDLEQPLFGMVDKVLDQFYEAGVGHPYDASIFAPGVSSPFTAIDFATWDAMAVLTDNIEATGRLPDGARTRWGR